MPPANRPSSIKRLRACGLACTRSVLFAFLTFAAALTVANTADAAQRRIALVVGNSEYTSVPRLDNPSHDATLIANTLKTLGFTLIGDGPQLDLDRASLEGRIREFGRTIGEDTVALFYYSGHGLQIRGANYLVPVTAKIAAASDVDFELVDLDVVLRQMDAAHSRLNIVILDACRNNPFGGRGLRDSGGGLAEVRAPRGTLISYATQPGGVARDGEPGGDSPYTIALASAMKTSGIDVFKAFNMVGVKVNQVTNGEQTPWVSSSPIDGEFYLAAPPSDVAPAPSGPVAQPPAAGPPAFPTFDRDAIFWQSIQNSGKPEELEAYLRQFPNGTFADLARTRLALLQTPRRTAPATPSELSSIPAAPSNPAVETPAIDAPPSNPPATSASVAIGAAEILDAQRRLAVMGISRAGTDGRAGPRTSEAIRLFQRASGLPETGELTRPLLASMQAEPPPPSARAGALFTLASITARDGRGGEALGLYEQGLKLDPANTDARRDMESLRRAIAPRTVVTRTPPPAPAPVPIQAPIARPSPRAQEAAAAAVPVIRRSEPGPGSVAGGTGFTATAADGRGRHYFANGAASSGAAVGEALRMCHEAGDPAGCRIVSMAAGAAPR